MKTDNVVNSIINNMVNTPAFTQVSENTAFSRKPADDTVFEKEQDTEQAFTGKVDREKLSRTIDVANDAFKEVNVGFKYILNEKINLEIVQIINTETGEVIKQYPPEEIINMLERMYDRLGILIDKKF